MAPQLRDSAGFSPDFACRGRGNPTSVPTPGSDVLRGDNGHMPVSRLLIANRGEIAVRIARTAADLGVPTIGLASQDDLDALHVRRIGHVATLAGTGPAAYLDIDAVVGAAIAEGCDAVHPGYGLLSERAEFADACERAGLTFVGPEPDVLRLLGDKAAARRLAVELGVPVVPGTDRLTTVAQAAEFMAHHGPVMVKAIAGGGGRGMRAVIDPAGLAEAFERCESEARHAFGDGGLYVERYIRRARHIEVQVLGDGADVAVLGDRDCSLQRRHQKVVEFAPAPFLTGAQRAGLAGAARAMAEHVGYSSLATFEFLLDAESGDWWFIEANPRIQVEHTVTEAVTGLDLVALQLRVAAGARLADLDLDLGLDGSTRSAAGNGTAGDGGTGAVGRGTGGGRGLDDGASLPSRGTAVQMRIAAEVLHPDGTLRPSGGSVAGVEWPTGGGVRIDTAIAGGVRTNPRFDSLVAKVIVAGPGGHLECVARARRALDETRIDGIGTNLGFLRRLLAHPEIAAETFTTSFIDEHLAELAEPADQPDPAPPTGTRPTARRSGPVDPLAVLSQARTREVPSAGSAGSAGVGATAGPDDRTVVAPMPGTVVSISVEPGARVEAGEALLVMEAMKMEHVIAAPHAGVVLSVLVGPGDTVAEHDAFVVLEPVESIGATTARREQVDPAYVRPDLAEVLHRQAVTTDAERPDAVERRRRTGQRTARENIADLCDEGSFVEYGSLVVAAQRRRRTLDDLIHRTQADGMIAGTASINRDLVGEERSQAMVISYDYTVLAGTQGLQNHRKKDRMFEIAEQLRLPVVFFTEGGGGRPGDTDGVGMAGLDCMAFTLWGSLSGLVPLVAINSGRCFAGNAAILGCADVVIATANSSIGMGGPAMIEGGGLGVYHPDEVGPMDVQVPNGVVDIAVADEAEAVAVAKRYLSYFQGRIDTWDCADQRLLRHVVPENRKRAYDICEAIELLADTGSVLELRRAFGVGMITALARMEGRPVGIVANNPAHLAGAIDSDGADKAARFLQLCDAFDIPVVFLCDTPGMMVGPDIEATALVRHCSRLFVVGGSLTVPFMTVVLRKGYGLGAQAMAGGSFKAGLFTIAWPTGEFGGMGLEGAVKLGYRKELEAIEDPAERLAAFEEMVARMYEHGKALSTATHFEIDDVIDPADTRARIVAALRAAPPAPARTGKKRPCIDTW